MFPLFRETAFRFKYDLIMKVQNINSSFKFSKISVPMYLSTEQENQQVSLFLLLMSVSHLENQ